MLHDTSCNKLVWVCLLSRCRGGSAGYGVHVLIVFVSARNHLSKLEACHRSFPLYCCDLSGGIIRMGGLCLLLVAAASCLLLAACCIRRSVFFKMLLLPNAVPSTSVSCDLDRVSGTAVKVSCRDVGWFYCARDRSTTSQFSQEPPLRNSIYPLVHLISLQDGVPMFEHFTYVH